MNGPIAQARDSQRAWKQLPRTRRRALEVRGASPDGPDEARAVIDRGQYLGSWLGAAEWIVGGAIGVGIAVVLQYLLAGQFPWDPMQPVIFVAIFGLAGVLLRRWRGRQLVERGRSILATGPDDTPGEFGPPPADG